MAKKAGSKKDSKQRPQTGAQKKASAKSKADLRQDRPQQAPPETAHVKVQHSKGSRLAELVRSSAVRNALAATLVSAAGALLYKKRRDDSGDDQSAEQTERPAASTPRAPAKPAGTRGRKTTERSSLPLSGDTDAAVAAGVAGGGRKKRPAGATPAKRGRKAAPETEAPSAESSDPPQALPGAFPDGSPIGDTAGRTSIEGGTDRNE